MRGVTIGKSFNVRVTDHDMNVDDEVRDRVSVAVRPAGGDMEIIVLEETGQKTGVFEGSITTEFDIDEQVHDSLELSEGEKLTVAYVDQARRRGERNVDVVRTVTATAAIGALAADPGAPRRR